MLHLQVLTILLVAATATDIAAEITSARPEQTPAAPWAKIASTSSLGSVPGQIRQRAFDGLADTMYRSEGVARKGDHLTFTFDAPVPIRAVAVTTGGLDGADRLDAGTIEVSTDGTTFEPVATCDGKGLAQANFAERSLRAVRLMVTRDLGHPLVVREFAVTGDRVRPFQHPVEFTVNCTDAPDLQAWTEATARLCEQWYDTLNDTLPSPGTTPADHITITIRQNYRGVAAARMETAQIVGSVAWFRAHPNDQGAMIHETLHIIQRYPRYGTAQCPAWLGEGIDDYVRFFVFEPGKAGPVPPRRASYDASYRVTATFLDYLTRTYDKQIVSKLDLALRHGTYKKSLFQELTGKTAEALNDEWRISMGLPSAEKPKITGPVSHEKGTPVGEIHGGPQGASFQDEAQGNLTQVVVGGGWWIDSITSTWSDAKEDHEGTTHGGGGGSEEIVKLESGESLIQVTGLIRQDGDRDVQLGQSVIGSLTFRTTKRTIRPIGTSTQGEKFTLEAPQGQEICGFRGRAGQYLNALGIICRPLP